MRPRAPLPHGPSTSIAAVFATLDVSDAHAIQQQTSPAVRRTTDDGRRVTGDGRRATDEDYGRRTRDYGRGTTDYGRGTTDDATVIGHLARSPPLGPGIGMGLAPESGLGRVRNRGLGSGFGAGVEGRSPLMAGWGGAAGASKVPTVKAQFTSS